VPHPSAAPRPLPGNFVKKQQESSFKKRQTFVFHHSASQLSALARTLAHGGTGATISHPNTFEISVGLLLVVL
jgi:hypothetical protein